MNNHALDSNIITRLFSGTTTPRGGSRNGMGRRIAVLALLAIAAGLLFASLKLPLWQMRMEAPQYRGEEALKVVIYPEAMRGDLTEIKVLNQYIGVHIPEALPQLTWLPLVLINAAVFGVIAGFFPRAARRRLLVGLPIVVGVLLLVAAGQAQKQMYDVGHNRDAKTAMVGVKDFTPPLLGTVKLAQFHITSSFSLGAYLIGAALALQFGAAWLSRSACSANCQCARRRLRDESKQTMEAAA